jgi:hypothetical protein
MARRSLAGDRSGDTEDHEITGDRDQVIKSLGCHQLIDALVVLFAGQPAFGVRGAQHSRHLLTVGIGGTQVTTGDGANISRFREGLGHPPKLALAQWRHRRVAERFRARVR